MEPGWLLVVRDGEPEEAWYTEPAVRTKILNQLRFLGIRVKSYTWVDCRVLAGAIDTLIFSKVHCMNTTETNMAGQGGELVEASCSLLVNCSRPGARKQ